MVGPFGAKLLKGCGSGNTVRKENETTLGMPALGALVTTGSWPKIPCREYSGMGPPNAEYLKNTISGRPGMVFLTYVLCC